MILPSRLFFHYRESLVKLQRSSIISLTKKIAKNTGCHSILLLSMQKTNKYAILSSHFVLTHQMLVFFLFVTQPPALSSSLQVSLNCFANSLGKMRAWLRFTTTTTPAEEKGERKKMQKMSG